MLKKFLLFTGCFSLIAMIACSSNDVAGGTIDPNTLAAASSSSIAENKSSSSTKNNADEGPDIKTESSSDSDIYPDNPFYSSSSNKGIYIESRNFDIKYNGPDTEDGVYIQPVPSAAAYKSIEGDSVSVTLQNVSLASPCETDMLESFVEFVNSKGVSTALNGDTLYANMPQSQEFSYDCAYSVTIFFTLDKEYSDFSYAIFDHKDKMSVKEKIKKVDN